MNPRVSRSSALASKATGYPIAKVAAKLAVGYTLDEIPNDLTKTTPASFEPTLDYVVVKIPRFAFEKFPAADRRLGTQMKSVGETMGIGRTFGEAFVKAERGLEAELDWEPENLHPWFRRELEGIGRGAREAGDPEPVYRRIDSCAGEVAAESSYYYATWDEADEAPPQGDAPRVVILGSGPNRIGQGIEFDYCCVHAAQAFRALGYEAVMVNCNPETVSTDYDTSDRLYFEPLDPAAVLAVCRREQPQGVVIQFGGQTPLKLAATLEEAGIPILGTPFGAVDLAEDRERFGRADRRARHPVPGRGGSRTTRAEAVGDGCPHRLPGARAPVVRARRPRDAHLLLGRAGASTRCSDVQAACSSTGSSRTRSRSTSTRCRDGDDTATSRAVMQHVEEAGVHSGDSGVRAARAVARIGGDATEIRRSSCAALARGLGVVGLLNVQLAVADGEVYVLEANPRASRTVPFASKATGVNLVAGGVQARGRRSAHVASSSCRRSGRRAQVSVKAAVLPFRALPRRRPGARSRDALDRRGDGERARLSRPRSPKAERAAGRAACRRTARSFLSVRDCRQARGDPGRGRARRSRLHALSSTGGHGADAARRGASKSTRCR